MRRIRRSVAKVKSVAWLVWHTKHEITHILLGLAWAWFLRELWGQFNPRWIWLSLFASLAPDLDHVIYFYTYGRHDPYSKIIRYYLRHFQLRNLWVTIENGHKQLTSLATHNLFTIGFLLIISTVSYFYEWQTAVILFGAMLLHYAFDILDDLVILGSLNPNWKRIGRGKKPAVAPSRTRS